MNEQEPKTLELEIVPPTALESIERANVDMQITTARRYPRSLAIVKKRMLDLATLDQETAESCFYKLNRQGKTIEGPSIRLAEIAGSSFGNLRYGARIIANDGKTITAQGYCHDLETNVMCQVEVQRRITDRDGRTYSQDMQVVTGNAACAIAARNAIFKVVPFAFVKPIFSAAKQAAVGDIKTLAERRTRMLKQFAAMGIDEKRICATLGKAGVEEIGLSELETLIGLYNAVKEGEQNIDEAFPPVISSPTGLPPKDKPQTPPVTPAPEEPKKRGRKPKEPPQPSAPSAKSAVEQITEKLTAAGFTAENLLRVAIMNNWADTTVKELSEIEEPKLRMFLENWDGPGGTLEELEAQSKEKQKTEPDPFG